VRNYNIKSGFHQRYSGLSPTGACKEHWQGGLAGRNKQGSVWGSSVAFPASRFQRLGFWAPIVPVYPLGYSVWAVGSPLFRWVAASWLWR
jgi:hypothetical protein